MSEDKTGDRGCGEAELERSVEKLLRDPGREDCWEHLHECYRPRLLGLAMGRWKLSRDLAEELIQITFLKLYTHIGAFRRESSFSTWLFRIFSNARREVAADRRVRPSLDPGSFDVPDPRHIDPADREQDALRRKRLAREIARLPPQQRTCVLLKHREGLAVKQIAALLGISPNTVRVHLFQAVKRLKRVLGEED